MLPNSQYWEIENFTKLEYIKSYSFRFFIPLCAHLPKFNIILTPNDSLNSVDSDSVRFEVEHERTVGYNYTEDIPETHKEKDAYFTISFINGEGEKCKTQEARLSLFKNPNRLYDQSVQFNIPYYYFLDPKNDLIQNDKLNILIEGRTIDKDEFTDKLTIPKIVINDDEIETETENGVQGEEDEESEELESLVESKFVVQKHDSIEPFMFRIPEAEELKEEEVKIQDQEPETIPKYEVESLEFKNILGSQENPKCSEPESKESQKSHKTHKSHEPKYTLEYTWTVRHVSKMKSIFKSPEIPDRSTGKSLKIVYNLNNSFYGSESECVGITVELTDSEQPDTKFQFRLSIFDSNENKCFTREGQAEYHNFVDKITNTYFTFARAFLFDPKNSFIKNDQLILHAEMLAHSPGQIECSINFLDCSISCLQVSVFNKTMLIRRALEFVVQY